MDILKRIEGTAFTIMDIHLRFALSGELQGRDYIEEIAIMPETVVKYVCKILDSDLYKHVEMSAQQREDGMLLITNIIEKDRSNEVGETLSILSSVINPLGSAVKQVLRARLDESPIYLELRNLYASFGMDLVLGVFDELINRGETPQKVLTAAESLALEFGYSELLKDELEYNVANGISSGDNQKTEAKVSEAAAGMGGAVVGAKVGAILGSVVPVFGTVLGAAAGSTIGNTLAKKQGNKLGQENEEAVAQIIGDAKAAKDKIFKWLK